MDAACPTCKLFSCLVAKYAETVSDDWKFYLCLFPTSALYGVDWTWEPDVPGVEKTLSFSILDEDTFVDESRVCQPEFIRAVGCISPLELHLATKENTARFGARLLGPSVDFSVIKSWLNYCEYHHLGACHLYSERSPRSLTVIDCHKREIIQAGDRCQYLALSYVWGMATQSTGQMMSRQGALPAELPETIEDAILVTKELGFSYLWIDRYCIPHDDAKERYRQISQMDQIYAGAEATIIAVAGGDPKFGLPGVHHRPRHPATLTTINGATYAFVPPDPAHEIGASTWHTRAWTYQEAVLSRRRLFFCEQQVYFECSGMHCYEAMEAPLNAMHIKSMERFSEWNEPALFVPITREHYPLDKVFDHLSQYTARALSYPDDILNGMLGILEAFERRYGSILHFTGITMAPDDTVLKYCPLNPEKRSSTREEQFATGLCWKLKSPSKRREGFPSWSWTGWYGTVLALSGYEGYIHNTHDIRFSIEGVNGEILDWERVCHAITMGVSTERQTAHLVVDADIITVRLSYSPDHENGYEEGRLMVICPEYDIAAYIESDGELLSCARFFLTRGWEEVAGHVVLDTNSSGQFTGLVLGVRQGAYYSGLESEPSRRTQNDGDSTLLVLVLLELDGFAERIGLIEYNTYLETVDGVRKHYDLSRIPRKRQRLWLR